MIDIDIYKCKNRFSSTYSARRESWSTFALKLNNPERVPLTVEDYAKLPKEKKSEIKDRGGYVGGKLRDGIRRNGHVESRCLVCLDADNAVKNFIEKAKEALPYIIWVVHSSFGHTPEKPRYRLVIPLKEVASEEEYPTIAYNIALKIGIENFDKTSFQAERMMFFPACPKDAEYIYQYNKGELLDKTEYLTPIAKEVTHVRTERSKIEQRTVAQTGGVIGAFCKAYPIHTAISLFLSHIYVPSKIPNRYDYVLSESPAGLNIMKDEYAYSHHATDPANDGHAHNAFDLVKIHLFGGDLRAALDFALKLDSVQRELREEKFKQAQEFFKQPLDEKSAVASLDEEAIPSHSGSGIEPNGLNAIPSHSGSEQVKTPNEPQSLTKPQQSASEGETRKKKEATPPYSVSDLTIAKAMPSPESESSSPKTTFVKPVQSVNANDALSDDELYPILKRDKKGKVINCLENALYIIKHDHKLQGIRYNSMANYIELTKRVPWRMKTEPAPDWREPEDDAQLLSYITLTYGVISKAHIDVALIKIADDRRFHPVKEYLKSLPDWDGVSRLDALLIDYLGAQDSPYIRAITRKTLCAAIRRIYSPGIKFDAMLVLVGAQGLGKSTLISRLGGAWFSDAISITDMQDKTAAEKLAGYWLHEIPEMQGMGKVDQNALKSFLTRADDRFRGSYAKRPKSNPRQCVFIGTSNEEDGFLRDPTGGRRFWPAPLSANSVKKPWDLTQEEVDQIWAEALIYAETENLTLPEELNETAKTVQREHIALDDRAGLVAEYLDMLLPADWDTLNRHQRRDFFKQEAAGNLKKGIYPRETVSRIEIWAECFGQRPADISPKDSYAISSILENLGGWERQEKAVRIPLYGLQRLYKRIGALPEENYDLPY